MHFRNPHVKAVRKLDCKKYTIRNRKQWSLVHCSGPASPLPSPPPTSQVLLSSHVIQDAEQERAMLCQQLGRMCALSTWLLPKWIYNVNVQLISGVLTGSLLHPAKDFKAYLKALLTFHFFPSDFNLAIKIYLQRKWLITKADSTHTVSPVPQETA